MSGVSEGVARLTFPTTGNRGGRGWMVASPESIPTPSNQHHSNTKQRIAL